MSSSAPRCRPARSHTCRCSTSWRTSIFAASPTAHPSTCTCSSRRRGTPSPTATASSATRTSSRRPWTGSCQESTRGRSPAPSTARLRSWRRSGSSSRGSPTPTVPCTTHGATTRSRGRSAPSPRRPQARATAPPTSASSTETGTWWPARIPRWRTSAQASSCRARGCSSATE